MIISRYLVISHYLKFQYHTALTKWPCKFMLQLESVCKIDLISLSVTDLH